MSDLRLILLVSGLVLIAVIYFFGSNKERQRLRKSTIKQPPPEEEIPELRISPRIDADDDISATLSNLNDFLTDSKSDQNEQDELVPVLTRENDSQEITITEDAIEDNDSDMFSTEDDMEVIDEQKSQIEEEYNAVATEQIITLHITASPIKTFNGREILNAVSATGLEFGEMNIFHHFGIGDMKNSRPLFSLTDMFEPGTFDLEKIDSLNTRGLSLFLCLPTPVDGGVVFELMLNTAQRMADMLGGEIRGPDHCLIDDNQITTIRNNINMQMH